MSITNKGKKWEILNSLWIVWSFVCFLSWIGFFWIGVRAKQKKWMIFGWLYLIAGFVLPMLSGGELIKFNTSTREIISLTWILVSIASIIHTLLSRKEYLVRREAILNNIEAENMAYRQEIQNEYRKQGNQQVHAVPQTPRQTGSLPPQQPGPAIKHIQPTARQKMDLNTCTENQLAALPGVGVALSKKAMLIRNETGGFASVDDFNNRLGLMPHFAVQIEKLAYVSAIMPAGKPPEKTGRVVDI